MGSVNYAHLEAFYRDGHIDWVIADERFSSEDDAWAATEDKDVGVLVDGQVVEMVFNSNCPAGLGDVCTGVASRIMVSSGRRGHMFAWCTEHKEERPELCAMNLEEVSRRSKLLCRWSSPQYGAARRLVIEGRQAIADAEANQMKVDLRVHVKEQHWRLSVVERLSGEDTMNVMVCLMKAVADLDEMEVLERMDDLWTLADDLPVHIRTSILSFHQSRGPLRVVPARMGLV